MKELLQTEAQALNTALIDYLSSGPKSINEFKIDCSKLTKVYLTEDVRHSVEFKDIFEELERMKDNPCLYIFEIESEISTKEIIEKIKLFKKTSEKRIPAIKSNWPENSKTLYVGKSDNHTWGRLITHMGLHTNTKHGVPEASTNHGLQLVCWAKDMSLKLKYTVIEFEPGMKHLLPVLEKRIAHKLQPIIGKH